MWSKLVVKTIDVQTPICAVIQQIVSSRSQVIAGKPKLQLQHKVLTSHCSKAEQ